MNFVYKNILKIPSRLLLSSFLSRTPNFNKLKTTKITQLKQFHTIFPPMGIDNIKHFQKEQEKLAKNGEDALHQELVDEAESEIENLKKQNNGKYPFVLSKNSKLSDFIEANKKNTDKLKLEHPEILELSGKGQSPHTLWIGCSDSRINEATALGVLPGEVFTLRNIANVISSQDFSAMGAIQFAIEVLKVKKIIVCGHTDCGGVWASLSSKKVGGVLDHWLNNVRHVRAHNLKTINSIENPIDKCTKLSELNVINSVHNLKRHPSFVSPYKLGEIEVYGLIYDVKTGYLKEIEIPHDDEFEDVFHVSENGNDDEHNAH